MPYIQPHRGSEANFLTGETATRYQEIEYLVEYLAKNIFKNLNLYTYRARRATIRKIVSYFKSIVSCRPYWSLPKHKITPSFINSRRVTGGMMAHAKKAQTENNQGPVPMVER